MARVSSQPGAMAVLRRPRPAGTRQYIYIHHQNIHNPHHIYCIFEHELGLNLHHYLVDKAMLGKDHYLWVGYYGL